MLSEKDVGKRVICGCDECETALGEAVAVPANAPDQRPGEDMPLPARLRRWVEAHTPAGVTATALRALLSEAADEIERLTRDTRTAEEECAGAAASPLSAPVESWIRRPLPGAIGVWDYAQIVRIDHEATGDTTWISRDGRLQALADAGLSEWSIASAPPADNR